MNNDFILGFCLCMLADVVFAVVNLILERTYALRAERRRKKSEQGGDRQ